MIKKIHSKTDLDLSNDSFINNKRSTKINQNYNICKDTTVNSVNNSYIINNNNNYNNNKNLNYPELHQENKIYLETMEEKYDKYKNLENPFTTPDIPINTAKERRTKIINRINKERMNYQSKSVDNFSYKNIFQKKRNSYLENKLFDNDQDIN